MDKIKLQTKRFDDAGKFLIGKGRFGGKWAGVSFVPLAEASARRLYTSARGLSKRYCKFPPQYSIQQTNYVFFVCPQV